ncbi:CU044_5270 family protein [Kitasatospora sp. NPDC058170]|uniref:CU044_5270 family protein n=1 Tax=Kitasatospora sp. NPDC058170 TaxID=3346364 RepID=UPI0036D8A0DE
MIRNTQRRDEPLDHAELARLLPAPADPHVAPERLLLLEEHFMDEVHRTHPDTASAPVSAPAAASAPAPARRPLRRAVFFGTPVAAAAALAAVVALAGTPGPAGQREPRPVKAPVVQVEAGSTVQLASTVRAIAAAAQANGTPQPKPGQFIYVKRQVSWVSTRHDADAGTITTWVQPLHTREVWKSPDGSKGWLDEPGYQDEGGITLDSDSRPNHLTYQWLAEQPADAGQLLKAVYGTVSGPRDRDQQAFNEIGAIIGEQLVPAQLAAPLYQAAGEIPGVVVVEHSQDGAGRDGIALARLDPQTGERIEWIFDRTTYQYLGSRGVQVTAQDGIQPGTVVERTTVVERAVVDAKGQRPRAGEANA